MIDFNGGSIRISDKEFEKLGKLIYDNFGINLTAEKRQLVEGRFQKILRNNNLKNFSVYLNFLNSHPSQKHDRIGELVNQISTNHTFFYREPKHFELMEKEWLPELIKKNASSKKLRVWCAASSTGEEPYTLLAILLRTLGANYRNWDTGVLATDISSKALGIANDGIYSRTDVDALPKMLSSLVFEALNKSQVKVKESVKSEIMFRRFNLMNPLPFRNNFDLVFCRNVMIYFDKDTTVNLVNRIYQKMNPGGYFIISLSESLVRDKTPFKYICPGVYIKN